MDPMPVSVSEGPTSGKTAWRDHELTGASEAQLTACRCEQVGFVLQVYNLIPSLISVPAGPSRTEPRSGSVRVWTV